MNRKSAVSSSALTLACVTAVSIVGYTLLSARKKDSSTKSTPSSRDASDTNDPQEKPTTNHTIEKVNASIPGQIDISQPSSNSALSRLQASNTITIAYASTTGTCKNFAIALHDALKILLKAQDTKVQMCTTDELDWWDELLNNEEDEDASNVPTAGNGTTAAPVVIFILPTWTGGTLPEQYAPLLTGLDEICHDWRVAPRPLRHTDGKKGAHFSDTKSIQIASFGMGSTAYDTSTFCKPAKDVFKSFMKLGARSLLTSHGKSVVGMGDDDAGDCKAVFNEWMDRVMSRVEEMYGLDTVKTNGLEEVKGCCKDKENGEAAGAGSCGCQEEKTGGGGGCCSTGQEEKTEGGGGCCSTGDDDEEVYSDEEEDDDDDGFSDYESDYDEEEKEPEIMDLEDMGNAMKSTENSGGKNKVVKEMVTPKQAAALKKEGYRIIGTHSAVKLCRWTKHQLRGRGGCYKHTFYGITSYQCMEATPSLACANKCVFCWRHHKNPVGREWRWKVDDPYEIVDQAVKEHISMIKETKGIPGVLKERWEEAHTVRHCALSLVGEPIMYPRIDEFLGDLHKRHISTYLVTNGQHPKAIETLRPITQLYVSVDASTPETLEAIDRPLFKDAWDRLRYSLKCLKDKGQRTVARLTVVKGWNSDEIGGYAKLIALGHCSLVEVKGVTFCGKSDASNLNMSNSPWHHEVIAMVQNLQLELQKIRDETPEGKEKIPEYGIACEHKHSVSVLLARVDQFAVDDPETGKRRWRTWIDYDKFQQLAAKNAEDPTFTFGVEDYVEDTPDWALFGAEEAGFDPTDTRHRKKKRHPKYNKFDSDGVPTHDDVDTPLSEEERAKLVALMNLKKRDIGGGVSVIDLKSGEKVIDDASLMFRGLTVIK